MNTRFYDTDLTDAAWAWVAPVLPAARPGGRPRTTNLRAILNAIFYLLRTGCQWRLLPREFPPFGTVYHYFQAWQISGVWVHLHRVLYEQARRDAGRAACPSVVIMDEMLACADPAFDGQVILFQDVVKVLQRSMRSRPLELELV